MNVSSYKRGNWLKASDTKSGELIEFLNAGVETEGFGGKPALEFNIKLLSDGSEIKMTPNRPSISALAEAWGDESSGWIGKQAIIEIKSEIINGEDKDFIVLTPNDEVAHSPVSAPINQDEIPVHDPADPNEEAQIAK